jgi:hypothetical protein
MITKQVSAHGRFWDFASLLLTKYPLQVYMNDSVGQKITTLDFDLESGAISNQRTLVDFHGTTSEPDGMVIE